MQGAPVMNLDEDALIAAADLVGQAALALRS
jgi:hypothetical protein